MNLDLSQKYALVCGSTQGLGFASAVELALLGCNVTLVARNEQKLTEAVAKLDTSRDQKHNYFVADFQYPHLVKAAIDNHLVQHPVINILVNNTGGPKAGKAIDADVSEYLQAFNSHLICNQLLAQAVVPSMISSGFGRIINIISLSVKQPVPGLGVSNTIRGAVASWAKTLAGELGPHGITVNNVLPGYTKTARLDSLMASRSQESGKPVIDIEESYAAGIPLKRIGKAEEFGAAVAFLCSPAAAYINGINLPVDGGMLSTL
jgi:3-oxoacyl-[acyl-carrier protein] reductase